MLQPLIGKLERMQIVLASSSKQRKQILESTGLKVQIFPSKFEENLRSEDYSVSEYVEETALRKAKDVYEQLQSDGRQPDIIIGCDTMVAFDGKIYGKPKTREEAVNMITMLTSRRIPNMVYSGVAILYRNKTYKFTEVTTVYMGQLSEQEIISYVDSGEPYGKAGAYGIQGLASSFVERIDGDVNNVIGFPLYRLTQKLKEIID